MAQHKDYSNTTGSNVLKKDRESKENISSTINADSFSSISDGKFSPFPRTENPYFDVHIRYYHADVA